MPTQTYERTPGAATAPLPSGYRRRQPEQTPLYQLVRCELETFRREVQALGDGNGLPSFVWREFERYLDCGILALGFARVRCPLCGDELLVGFSCKGRGLCPSCGARRMHDTAAHLVDRVLPRVPYRQWVLAFPKWLRPHLARDPPLASAVQKIFLAAVFAWQRKQSRALGLRRVGVGAVTFGQRAGDSLNLNPHLHSVVPDGVFEQTDDEVLFHRLPRPHEEDILWVAARVVRRTRRLLERLGILQSEASPDLLDTLASATLNTGRRRFDPDRPRAPLSAWLDGYSLQAGTHVHQNDRAGLEHLCRYGARPPLALERLSRREDGRYVYALKYPLADGAYELVLSGQQLMARLALLIPRPKVHLVRYRGVFASHSRWRKLVVPAPQPRPASLPVDDQPRPARREDEAPRSPAPQAASRLPWAELLKRVFGIDVLTCDRCGGTRRIIAFIEQPAVARRILEHFGLPAAGLPRAGPRPPPQRELLDGLQRPAFI